MNKNISSDNDKSTLDIIIGFVADLLKDGVPPSDLCFCLTAAGLELGLITAPSPEHALNIVSSALYQVSKSRIPEDDNEDAGTNDSVQEPEIEPSPSNHADGQTVH